MSCGCGSGACGSGAVFWLPLVALSAACSAGDAAAGVDAIGCWASVLAPVAAFCANAAVVDWSASMQPSANAMVCRVRGFMQLPPLSPVSRLDLLRLRARSDFPPAYDWLTPPETNPTARDSCGRSEERHRSCEPHLQRLETTRRNDLPGSSQGSSLPAETRRRVSARRRASQSRINYREEILCRQNPGA